jgi:hypothetical protein
MSNVVITTPEVIAACGHIVGDVLHVEDWFIQTDFKENPIETER